jgi:hypothetical protein
MTKENFVFLNFSVENYFEKFFYVDLARFFIILAERKSKMESV